ncbi:MalY/PatB family protein [Gracilibacillus sp. YIM 98692]|uniref:MalY/PatB family protein n=1 Tax=Gracilibacillus sp. YIM 98692 TaxID=2663532 RepID=UPI0013D00335|nr:MalY/PatB family protein [Gracilibacillus sp. YIM 98692]
MEHDFQQLINRQDTRSVKWDLVETLYGSKDVLPMWVADMDFQVPKAVSNALSERALHGIFGYTYTDKQLNEIVVDWVKEQHHWTLSKAWILYSPGVISTIHMAIQSFTNKGDKVLIQTPVYPPFYDIIKKHERTLVTNPLQLNDQKYEIDFEDLEEKLKQGVKAFILCNPHNPVGRVWTKEELQHIITLCKKYEVLIISDEIHADIVYKPHQHIPIASLDEEIQPNTITCMSPTKTFNLAGLQVSYVIVSDKKMRDTLKEMFHKQGMHMINTMGITALEASYTSGKTWLNQLTEYLRINIQYVLEALQNRNDVKVIQPEGTYLIWLDFRGLGWSHQKVKSFLQEKAKVGLNDGASFGEDGEGFMRLNIACPTQRVEEGIHRIIQALDKIKEEE